MSPEQINVPRVVAEVRAAFEAYEAVLLRNDAAALNEFFWDSALTVRYGIAEQHRGIEAIRQWRLTAPAIHATRRLRGTTIVTFGEAAASVCTEFVSADTQNIGRQSQTWVRVEGRWRIVAAHVSLTSAALPVTIGK